MIGTIEEHENKVKAMIQSLRIRQMFVNSINRGIQVLDEEIQEYLVCITKAKLEGVQTLSYVSNTKK